MVGCEGMMRGYGDDRNSIPDSKKWRCIGNLFGNFGKQGVKKMGVEVSKISKRRTCWDVRYDGNYEVSGDGNNDGNDDGNHNGNGVCNDNLTWLTKFFGRTMHREKKQPWR